MKAYSFPRKLFLISFFTLLSLAISSRFWESSSIHSLLRDITFFFSVFFIILFLPFFLLLITHLFSVRTSFVAGLCILLLLGADALVKSPLLQIRQFDDGLDCIFPGDTIIHNVKFAEKKLVLEYIKKGYQPYLYVAFRNKTKEVIPHAYAVMINAQPAGTLDIHNNYYMGVHPLRLDTQIFYRYDTLKIKLFPIYIQSEPLLSKIEILSAPSFASQSPFVKSYFVRNGLIEDFKDKVYCIELRLQKTRQGYPVIFF